MKHDMQYYVLLNAVASVFLKKGRESSIIKITAIQILRQMLLECRLRL